MKTVKTGILLSLAFVTVLSCSMVFSDGDSEPEAVSALSFNRASLSVPAGTSDYLGLSVTPSSLQTTAPIRWQYDETKVAVHPDSYGAVITGVSFGETYVTANSGGVSTTCLVTVAEGGGEYTGTPYIYSNTSVIEMTPGTVQTVSASLYGGMPYDFEDFSWQVSDSSVASIRYTRNNCIVTANRTGTCRVTATHPKSPYPYNFIVYAHNDDFNEPYLTTDANVVTINKTLSPARTVGVSVVNPYRQVHQAGFAWEVISEGEPAVGVNANGGTALLTPLAAGVSLVRVSYEDCQWPLDILVRVTSAVENVYVIPSVSTLEVSGSTRVYTVTAELTGYSGYADPEGFTWEVPPSAGPLMDWQASGNSFSVTGKMNGIIKVRVSHELSDYARSILVVLREQAGSAIDASMFITTSSNYVQTKVGASPTTISVTISGGTPGDENDLIWTIDDGNNNDIILIETTTGRVESRARSIGSFAYGTLHITPRAAGSATVTITHPKILFQTEILVKVYSENALLEEPAYIISDSNLVKMLNGQTRELTVSLQGNTAPGDENAIAWQSENPPVISVSPATGATVVLSALGSGNNQTYVSASHDKALSQKRILVLSADTQEALDTMKGLYTDTAYFRVNEGGTVSLSCEGFNLTDNDKNSIQWSADNPGLATVSVTPGNRLTASVSAIAPGNAVVTARLSGCEPVTFSIAILPEGESTELILPKYLTTVKNAIHLSSPGQYAQAAVTGVNVSAYEMISTSWTSLDASVASVSGSSGNATVTAAGIGRTSVAVSNPHSGNSLSLDVKVGALYEWEESFDVYITTGQEVVTLVKGQSTTIGAALVNSTETSGFSWSLSRGGNLVDIAGSWSGSCYVQALEAGIAEITVRHALSVTDKEILVVIANTPEELAGFPYLTTNQNVVRNSSIIT
jgi:hypothetical protein